MLALALSALVVCAFVTLATIDRDALETGVALTVAAAFALAAARFVGSWLMRSARNEFRDSVVDVVREEMRTMQSTQEEEMSKTRHAIEGLTTAVAAIDLEDVRMQLARNRGWIFQIASHVGMTLDD